MSCKHGHCTAHRVPYQVSWIQVVLVEITENVVRLLVERQPSRRCPGKRSVAQEVGRNDTPLSKRRVDAWIIQMPDESVDQDNGRFHEDSSIPLSFT